MSSQFLSAMLMASAQAKGETVIEIKVREVMAVFKTFFTFNVILSVCVLGSNNERQIG